MNKIELTVEIEDSKRFNDKGLEVYRPSGVVKTSSTGKTMHQYTGTVVVATAADFQNGQAERLGQQLLVDLYADHSKIKTPLDALVDVLNNGGLRLAYGDRIKSQHKTGASSRNLLAQAARWMLGQPAVLAEVSQLPEADREQALIDKFLASQPKQ